MRVFERICIFRASQQMSNVFKLKFQNFGTPNDFVFWKKREKEKDF